MPEPTHNLGTELMTRQYNVAGQPDTHGPCTPSTIQPRTLTLHTYGTPKIEDASIVSGVTIRGRVVAGAPGQVGKSEEVYYSCGLSSVNPLPEWVSSIFDAEGLHYGPPAGPE